MQQQILPTGPQPAPSHSDDRWTWVITVVAVIVALGVTVGGVAVKQRLSEPDEPPMDPLLAYMSLCVEQTLDELGPPPPTGDQLTAQGRDATSAFEGWLVYARWLGDYDRTNHRCATGTEKVSCDEPPADFGGCWRVSDPSAKVAWRDVRWSDLSVDLFE